MLLDGRAQTTGSSTARTERDSADRHQRTSRHGRRRGAAGVRGAVVTGSLLIDTQFCEPGEEKRFATGDTYQVTARSLLLFGLVPDQRNCVCPNREWLGQTDIC